MNDLSNPHVRARLAQQIVADYNEASVEIYREGFRKHLGASVIGDECSRLLWYGFRWIYNHNPGGRMYRLWQRGHREEPFAIEHLRKKGYTVEPFDPVASKAAGKNVQWRMSALHDHFGGSCDGRGYLPPSFGYTEEVGFEFKTSNARRFKEMKKDGVRKAKPKHYAQMSVYGRAWNIKYFVYCFFNKDDDDIYVEIVEVDWAYADSLLKKAEYIIPSPTPPEKLSEHPSYSICKYCDLARHCHYGAMPERNCRSCKNAIPTFKGQWYCSRHDGIIPDEVIVVGCNDWHSII